ncbi:phosphatidate cytidylyltransferase [Microaerobacter geothermalis]|uniref:phosphatidate cytidylyltransferase n=1 Tax=Microaerobacter geothermalis TaxID=674972 RepID=UPI001F2863E4|nr:phosphatidate cytidylyltransferase [Microaerobacter geothermalis]MCF6093802.1 phosphatidate cytidylyltransferase [Microaerobacter geothermalis]
MKKRIFTGLIGGTIFLYLLYLGEMWYSTLIFLLASFSFYEFLKMKNRNLLSIEGGLSLIFIFLLVLIPNKVSNDEFTWFFTATIIYFLLLYLIPVVTKNQVTIDHVAYTFFGGFYIGLGFLFFVLTRYLESGFWAALFVILITWTTDTFAYFSGLLLGSRKLWPQISPKKTIEGALGGILGAIIVASVFQWIFHPLTSIGTAIIIAFVISIAAQIGDLMESALKRHLGVKDSGNLLPGHGGILDRFDSLLIVFPIFYIMQFIL